MFPDPPQTLPGDCRRAVVRASLAATVVHLAMLLVGLYFFETHEPAPGGLSPTETAAKIVAAEASLPVRRWYHWDSLWFAHLARFGYQLEKTAASGLAQSNVAFPPGLPLVIRGIESAGFNPWVSVLVLNLIAAFLIRLATGLLAFRLTNSAPAATWAIFMQLCWPWQFFLIAPYQEAIGLAALAWALFCGLNGRFVAGFLLSFVAGLFRLNAVGFFAGLCAGTAFSVISLASSRKEKLKITRNWAFLSSGSVLAWALLNFYFYCCFANARVGLAVQQAWGRHAPNLLNILVSLFFPLYLQTSSVTPSWWLHWVVAWAVVLSIPIIWKKFGPMWALPVAGLAAQCLSTGSVMSFGRLALPALPFFVLMGSFADRRPRLALLSAAGMAMLQAWHFWRYGHDLFAG